MIYVPSRKRFSRFFPLTMFVLLPMLLLGFGVWTEYGASTQDRDVNRSGSLRFRSMWLYGATQTQTGEDWRAMLMQMQSIRADLRTRYPQAVSGTDSVWIRFVGTLEQGEKVDWPTANAMREAANTLTYAIEGKARHDHQAAFWLLLSGVVTTGASGLLTFRSIRHDARREHARQAADERFRVLFEQSSDAHLLFDDTGIIDCNNAAILMLECKDKNEVLALHPAVLSPEFQPDGRRSLEKCIEMDSRARENGYHRFEWTHRKANGMDFPAEVSLTPVIVNGRDTLLVVWHDLTERKQMEQELRASETRLRHMVENLPAGAVFVDGEHLLLNRAAEELTGYTREEITTLDVWFAKIYQEQAEAVYAYYRQHKASGFPGSPVVPIIHKDKTIRQVQFAAYAYSGGEVWLLHDMTEHMEATEALQVSEERFRRAFDDAAIGMTVTDMNARWLKINPAFQQMVGYTEEELMQGSYVHLTHPDDLPPIQEWFASVTEQGCRLPFRQEKRYFHKNGATVWAILTVSVTCDEQNVPLNLIGQIQDITARKEAEQQQKATNAELSAFNEQMMQQICTINEQAVELEYQQMELVQANLKLEALATTDGLTGLKNHRAFRDKLNEEWNRVGRHHPSLSIILLDVDKFKTYNDSFGHPEGDTVLKRVAAAMQATARDTDYVCRYGGEEFIILLPDTDAEGAVEAAERFRLAIEGQPWTLGPVTASFGVATAGIGIETPQELVDFADKALYASKESGRNRVTHYTDLNCRDATGELPCATLAGR